LREDGGQYRKAGHSVNYLESHDDHTFGDFIRLCIGKNSEDDIIRDIYRHGKLTPEEIRYHKLGAFLLGSAQGICMLHSGQEFGRSKVIEINDIPDPDQGKIDHNSYNKDNTTNYINEEIASQNSELTEFYAGMLRLRQIYPQLRKAPRESLQPVYADSQYGIGYHILPSANLTEEILVLANGSTEDPAFFTLPEGGWVPLISTHPVSGERFFRNVTLEPSCGLILIRR
jgi:pullulanase/glycogen debranching enzyme